MMNHRSIRSTTKIFLFFIIFSKYGGCFQSVKLTEIEQLSFYADKFTVNRRLTSVPQLKCDSHLRLVSYSNCYKFQPKVVHCFNRGVEADSNIRWECNADLDKKVRFATLKVNCEGYDFKNDPFVLQGSCGLEYSLETKQTKDFDDYYHTELYETNKLSNLLTIIIMTIMLLAIYKSCSKSRIESEYFNNNYFNSTINGLDCSIVTHTFPPPPPPYGFFTGTTNNPNIYKEIKSETSNDFDQDNVSNSLFRDGTPPPAYEERIPFPGVTIIKPDEPENSGTK